MSLLLLFSGAGGRSGIVRLGGILIQEDIAEEISYDDEEVFAIIRKFFEEGLVD